MKKALQNGGNTSESKVVSENFLHTGQMLISLLTHATESRGSQLEKLKFKQDLKLEFGQFFSADVL